MLYTGKHVRVFGTRDLKEPGFFFSMTQFLFSRRKGRRGGGREGGVRRVGRGATSQKRPPRSPLLTNPLPLFYTGVTELYVSGVQIEAGGTRSARSSQGEPAGERACLFLQHRAEVAVVGQLD